MKIKTFRNFLAENSLYLTKTEYDNLVSDKKKSAKIFLTSFVGSVVLYGLDHTKPIMTKYIKSEGSVRLSNMKDDNNDMSLAVKIANDAGVIRSTKAREITKFLYLIKARKIKDIDKDALRTMINEPILVMNLPGRYKSEFSSYIDGKQTIEQVFYNLKNVILSDDDIGTEFKSLFKRYRTDLSVSVKGSADDKDDDDVETKSSPEDKKEEVKTKAKVEVEKIENKKSLDSTGGTPPASNPYDLTLRKNINEHFIKMLSQPDPNAYLKSIGTGLVKFPWEKLVPIDAEVAKAFYRNRDTHNIKEPYLNRIMTKKRAKFQSMYANDISHLMSIKGFNILFEEGSLSIDEYIDGAAALKLPFDFKLMAKRSPKDDINYVLRVDQKLGEYNNTTIAYSYKDFFTAPPNSFSQLIIDDFKNIDRDLMLYANIHVMISYHKDLYRVNDNSIESLNKKYMEANHDKNSLYNMFNDSFKEYYEFLEENDFFNHPDLKKYKVKEVTLKTESDIYNFYKDKSLNLLPDSYTASTFVNYIIDNKVYRDFILSNPKYSHLVNINYISYDYGSIFNELKRAYDKDADNQIKKPIALLVNELKKEVMYVYLEQNSSELFGDVNYDKINILDKISEIDRGVSAYKDLTKTYGPTTINFDLISDKISFSIVNIVNKLGINFNVTSSADQIVNHYGDVIMELLITLDDSYYSQTPITFLFNNKIDSSQLNQLKKDVVSFIVKKYGEDAFNEIIKKVFDDVSYIKNKNLHRDVLSVFKEVSPVYYNIIMQNIISSKRDGSYTLITLIDSDLPFEDYINNFSTEQIMNLYSQRKDDSKMLELFLTKLNGIDNQSEIIKIMKSSLYHSSGNASDLVLSTFYKKDPEFTKQTIRNIVFLNRAEPYKLSTVISKTYETENSDLMRAASDAFVEIVGKISTKDIKEMFTHRYDTLLDIVLYSDKHASGVIDNLKSPTYSRRILESAATKLAISKSNIRDSLYNDPNITPLVEMDDTRLTKVLEYNDVKIKLSGVRRKKGEETYDYIKRVSETSNEVNFSEVEVENRSLSEEQLKRMTIEYEAFNSGNHGDTAIEFIESFNVGDGITKPEFYEFREKHSGTEMYPVFHGTGSVAASMILRFGYSVIDPNDESAVGRMLGNGIYFSNVIDKVAQYIGDSGYSRKKGTIGYIFEMDTTLGIKDTHYKSAGVDNSDGIRSPEWCVFDPAAQLSIKYTHKVRLISTQRINELRAEILGESTKNYATPILEFSSWLNAPKRQKMIKEQLVKEKYQYAATFIFNDGKIPVNGEQAVHFTQLKNEFKNKDNVYIESSAKGVSVIILYNDADMFYNDIYIVKSAEEWLLSTDEVKTAYIEALGE